MGLTLVHLDSDERFYDCIKEKELVNYDKTNYESPMRMRVKKESDPKDVVRRMDEYKHKKYKNEALHVLIPGKRTANSSDSFDRGATEHTSTRITKISTTGRTVNPPVNIVLFGKQTNITYTGGGEPAAKPESGSHRREDERGHHRHHRHQGSDDSKDNRHASPNRRRDGQGRETRRDRSRDTFRGTESDDGRSENRGKGSELDLREKTHGRKMHNTEDNSDPEYSETEIPRPPEKTPSERSSFKGRRSTHSSRQGAALEDVPEIDAISLTPSQRGPSQKAPSQKAPSQKVPSQKAPTERALSDRSSLTRHSSKQSSRQGAALEDLPETDAISLTPSQKAPSQKAVAERALSERSSLTGHSSRQSFRQGAALEGLPETDAISLAPSGEAYTEGRRSSRAPSTAGQSRLSQKTDPLIPSLHKLTEENMNLLDGKASQNGRNSTSRQHSEPRSQGDYEASRARRRSERASSGLSRKIES
ncbi:hypothetical protein BTUL_0014g00460 [Botrytis tulipae]|uniref:Uncharacterized protein n=1 Tax=Botrytis tulipae TaxID=87230 RepID=A0A4Z1F8P5_9HELO|nr:hypothetical protein BTUL_0014g00460 [Botrytis tulipae]